MCPYILPVCNVSVSVHFVYIFGCVHRFSVSVLYLCTLSVSVSVLYLCTLSVSVSVMYLPIYFLVSVSVSVHFSVSVSAHFVYVCVRAVYFLCDCTHTLAPPSHSLTHAHTQTCICSLTLTHISPRIWRFISSMHVAARLVVVRSVAVALTVAAVAATTAIAWSVCVSVSIPVRIMLVCCLLYTSPSPRDVEESRMPSSA